MGLGDMGQNVMAVGEVYCKAFYTYLMVVHFYWYGDEHLCKHDMTNVHDSMVDM